jgi:hypothetical protein
MRADAVYIVTTPKGHVSDCVAYSIGEATRRYVRQWLPPEVSPVGHVLDELWRSFENVGYRVHGVALPEHLEDSEVCLT